MASPRDPQLRKNATVPIAGRAALVRQHPAKYRVGDQRNTFRRDVAVADRLAGHVLGSGSLHSAASPAGSASKRVIDILGAALGLLFLLPGLLAIALVIKLTSRGSVLFRQQRYGLNNEMFTIYKFRTMDLDKGDNTGVKQTSVADGRVTRIGKVLRRTSLDELPQLINVLKGDMSLVGPRPHVPGMLAGGVPYEILVPNYFDRHRVRPGLTGLAQARGLRGCTFDPELAKARIVQDVKYIENWSFTLDLRIILETVRTEFIKAGNGI